MKHKFINNIKKYIVLIIIMLITFASGILVGNKITYQPSVYSKYCTDDKTGVQYIVVVSKEGDVAIFPRLNDDGTLYTKSKNKFIFVLNNKEKMNE